MIVGWHDGACMYAHDFFDTYWRTELCDEVFVAMPFPDEFTPVWELAARLAIETDSGTGLRAKRVDSSMLSGSVITHIRGWGRRNCAILVESCRNLGEAGFAPEPLTCGGAGLAARLHRKSLGRRCRLCRGRPRSLHRLPRLIKSPLDDEAPRAPRRHRRGLACVVCVALAR